MTNYSDAFNDYPDIAHESYKDDERFGLDGADAVAWFADVDHPGWKAEAAYALVELAYHRAYDSGDPADEAFAMDVHEHIAKPYTEFCFGRRDDLPEVDITPYRDELASIDTTTKQYGFQAQLVKAFPHPESAPHSFRDPHDYMVFADSLTDQIDPDDYDVVFTAWSKGIPFLDVAADHLGLDTGKQVVMRYSPSLDDTETQTTPVMTDRASRAGNRDFLFVDDVMMNGGTAETAYAWAKDRGAERVDGLFHVVMDNTDHFDPEQWPSADDNVVFDLGAEPATDTYRLAADD
jgi:adenine/guanine phosphoribosyltransferase-like PRPP-binding protein